MRYQVGAAPCEILEIRLTQDVADMLLAERNINIELRGPQRSGAAWL